MKTNTRIASIHVYYRCSEDRHVFFFFHRNRRPFIIKPTLASVTRFFLWVDKYRPARSIPANSISAYYYPDHLHPKE